MQNLNVEVPFFGGTNFSKIWEGAKARLPVLSTTCNLALQIAIHLKEYDMRDICFVRDNKV